MKKTMLLLTTLLMVISGCAQQAAEDKKTPIEGNTIVMDHFIFEPSYVTIDAGTRVTWKQNDNVAHTIVSQGLFESKTLNKGDEFSFTFTEPGEYEFHCGIHPSMTGKVIVK